MAEKKFKRYDPSILYGPQIVGEKVRELLKGKYEIIPKTTVHIKVNPKKCIGMTCQSICHRLVLSRRWNRYPAQVELVTATSHSRRSGT
jgi:hypothetical protein